jgi:iron(III) transport system permease protein
MHARLSPAHAAIAIAIALFLVLFLIVPVITVVYVAFTNSDGTLTLAHFFSFFGLTLMRESFYNSLYVGAMSVLLASIISLPLAYFTMRYRFRGGVLIQTLGVLPLIMPPFVGAAAMQLLFGRSGSVNLILNDCCGFGIPFMEGLNGVIFVEALHYFPFILLNLTVALANIDTAMEESAQNLGASGVRFVSPYRISAGTAGYLAGAALVFLKVFDDVGTPLVLNVTDILAVQALPAHYVYRHRRPDRLRCECHHGDCVARRALGVTWLMRGRDYATLQRGGSSLARRELNRCRRFSRTAGSFWCLLIVLSPTSASCCFR